MGNPTTSYPAILETLSRSRSSTVPRLDEHRGIDRVIARVKGRRVIKSRPGGPAAHERASLRVGFSGRQKPYRLAGCPLWAISGHDGCYFLIASDAL